MEESKRVHTDVFEKVEELALLREPCTLQFYASNGGAVTVQTKIIDVFEDEDGQYLLAENGLTLQLYNLIAINGKPLEHLS